MKSIDYDLIKSLCTLLDYATGDWQPTPEDLADAVDLANLRLQKVTDTAVVEALND